MDVEKAYVLWFDELHRKDVALVGGKSSSLGELTTSTGVPVPYGYATTAHAYRYFMETTGQNKKIHELLEDLTDVEDSVELHEVCTKIRESIASAEMPEDLAKAIGDAYEELAQKVNEKDPYVAVRSSATAEDLPDASFAGQQDTYLNVTDAIWSSARSRNAMLPPSLTALYTTEPRRISTMKTWLFPQLSR